MIKNIPIYDVIIDRDIDGVFAISLVNDPAVESNFILFSKEQDKVLFSIENEEERKVTGVVLRADYPIIRRNDNGELFYVTFSRETISTIAQKLFYYGAQNNIDLQHNFNYIEGVEMVEAFIKDSSKGISPIGFDDIADGSLFATYKITDDAIWDAIKEGTFKGFSVEGNFTYVPQSNYKILNIKEKMSKLFKTIRKAFVSFAEVKTDKGVLSYAGEEDIKIGDEVFVENEEGEVVPAADGDYTVEDGTVIVVVDGKVAEIKEKEEETVEETVEETKTEEAEEMEEEVVEETVEEEPKDDVIDALKAEIETLKSEIDAIKKTLADLIEKPAAEPVADEFEKVKTQDKKMSRAERLASYMK